MKKFILALLLLPFFSLNAAQAPLFVHKTSVTQNENKPGEYLAQFKIDKIVDDKAPPTTFTAPQLLCRQGEEAVVKKKLGSDSYIVKALIYKAGETMRAKTVILVFENDEPVYTCIEDFDV